VKATTRPGKYIVIEGIDGSGKTTQRDILMERLASLGIDVETVREPAGDAVGRAVRKILLDPQYQIDARTEVLLFNAARSGLMKRIQELTARGTWVVADRNFLSTIAYQGYGRREGVGVDEIRTICDFAVAGTHLDLAIILDGPPPAFARRKEKRGSADRIDVLGTDFFDRARHGYLAEAKLRSLPVVDATGSVDATAGLIWEQVAARLGLARG
jgi:dTMP kinase